jgi:P4 family phage/plasmid primase-like protien
VRIGATAEEWAHFDLGIGLTSDLLPVVSNTVAEISPNSKMKKLGKTPSIYNQERKAAGIAEWPERVTTGKDVERWAKEPDYGICVQTRGVRALDVDIDDPDISARVAAAFVLATGGKSLPTRYRDDSGKLLMAFRIAGEGVYTKRSFKTETGLVEFLATGQQFVACGTNPSGARYQWLGGLPEAIPEIDAAAFEAAWSAIVAAYAVSDPYEAGQRRKGLSVDTDDARALWLLEQSLVIDSGRDGALYVECPWKDGHSMDSGPTETAYFPAGTQGYELGHYKCLHASCAGRSDTDFDEALGYAQSRFDEIAPPVVKGPDGQDEEPKGERVYKKSDSLLLARAISRHVYRKQGATTLVRSLGVWYRHKGSHYAEVTEEDVRGDTWQFLGSCMSLDQKGNPVPLEPSQTIVSGAIDALKSEVRANDVPLPGWLPGFEGPEPSEIVSMRDGLLHLPTRKLLPHTPGLLTLNTLPYAWADSAIEPHLWLKFLGDIWPGDVEAQNCLQEVMGYLLTQDTSFQKMFMIVGQRRTGKGTIGRVIEGLLGKVNIAGPSMSHIGTQFGLECIVGKQAAIIPDARMAGGPGGSGIVEKLLMLSGEDNMTIDRKNKPSWTGQPKSRVVVLANMAPRLADASGALAGRFIFLSTNVSFYGREDRNLGDKLKRELPGIFRWALDGLDRLKARGFFVQPQSGLEIAQEFSDLGNLVDVFVRECCEIASDGRELSDHLFQAWRSWCADNGDHAGDKSGFVRSLKAAQPRLKSGTKRHKGKQQRALYGIRLQEDLRENLLIPMLEDEEED